MSDEVTPEEAIKRSLDAFAAEKGSFYESALRPMLDNIAKQVIEDLHAFGFSVERKAKTDAKKG